MNPKYFPNILAPCTHSAVFKRAINRVIHSIKNTLAEHTEGMLGLQFLSLVVGGQETETRRCRLTGRKPMAA